MKEKRNMWIIGLACSFLLPCVSLAQSGEEEIIQDFKSIIMLQDTDSYTYDKALEKVGWYVEGTDEEHFEETKEYLEETLIQFQKELEMCAETSYEMTEEFQMNLTEWGIEPEEYQMNADIRAVYLNGYEQNITLLLSVLEKKEKGYEVQEILENLYEQDIQVQECMRKSRFYEINYFFSSWDEEAVEKLDEEVLSELKSYRSFGQPWESDKKVIEEKIEVYLGQLEAIISGLSEKVGAEQEELYRLEQGKSRQSVPQKTD